LLDEHGLTQEQLGERVGKSRVTIANTLRLLHLPEPVRDALADGALTEGHARAILMANGETARLGVLERVLTDHLSVRDTEGLARALNASRTRPATDARPDPDVERLEDAFRRALGTRVRLVKGRRGGRLVITFFSDDELQGLYEAIVGDGR
jgi:ParB family transcriptional regulator, chromosome partitioning protein